MADPNPPAPPPPPDPPTWRTRPAALLGRTFVRQVLLVLGLLVTTYFMSASFSKKGQDKAEEWLNLYNATDVKADTRIGANADSNSNANTAAPRPSPTATTANANTNQSQAGAAGNANVAANSNQGATDATVDAAGGATAGRTEQATAAATATAATAPAPPTAEQQKRLDEQLAGIRARRNHHGEVMAYFFKAYYMAISMMMLAGLIAAVALFFIAQNGWTGTNPYVKTIFLVMTAVTAYYGLYPSVFEQQQNISDNKALFLAYKSLENEVVSYPLTLADITGAEKNAAQFITYVDSKMNTLGNIAIGFDYTKITYTGAFELNKGDESANGKANADGTPTPRKK